MKKLSLGCIADDFTGASDVASYLANEGVKTLLINGIPKHNINDLMDYEAIVIALKTRTMDKKKAIKESLDSLVFLQDLNVKQVYVKYCSTFDSTKEGNIGPIVDAIMDEMDLEYTVLCPSLPDNGRTVRDGNLYVYDVPLHESSMKNHPLTPMWDSDIARLMKPQSCYPAYPITEDKLYSSENIDEILRDLHAQHKRFYLIPDFFTKDHGEKIIELLGELPLLTGGSGLMAAIGKKIVKERQADTFSLSFVNDRTIGRAIILAGSCSKRTLEQIESFRKNNDAAVLKIDPYKLVNDEFNLKDVIDFIKTNKDKKILIHSSDTKENVKKAQVNGKFDIANQLEEFFGDIAAYAIENGFTRIIVAGGETSGAVAKRLGFDSYVAGSSISPGVPILRPLGLDSIRMVYKSGNFGDVDFFMQAIKMTKPED